MSECKENKRVKILLLVLLCIAAYIVFSSGFTKTNETADTVFTLETLELHLDEDYSSSGVCEHNGVYYGFYVEQIIVKQSSYSAYKQVVESEVELFENLADTYEVKQSTDYEDQSFTTIIGDWETEGNKKFVGVLYRKALSGNTTTYVEIICEEPVSYDEFKDTTNSLFEKLIEEIN